MDNIKNNPASSEKVAIVNRPTHDNLYTKLTIPPVTTEIAQYVFNGTRKGSTIYSSGSYKVRETFNIRGRIHKQYIEHDVILTLFASRNGKGNRIRKKSKTVCIEIKTTAGDLTHAFTSGRRSFEKYLGATDYFFIAVPRHLLFQLVKLHEHYDKQKRKRIGIIDADTGKVVVMPRELEVDENRMHNVLSHCMTSKENLVEFEKGSGLCSFNKAGTVNGEDYFTHCAFIKGVIVDRNYYDYFANN